MSHDEITNAFADHVDAFGTGSDGGDHLADDSKTLSEFAEAVELLAELSQAGLGDVDQSLQDTVELLGKLADSVESSLSAFNDDDPEVLETVDFVIDACGSVRDAALAENIGENDEALDVLREEVRLRLDACSDVDFQTGQAPSGDLDVVAPSQEEIAALLSGLNAASTKIETQDAPHVADEASPKVEGLPNVAPAARVGDSSIAVPSADNMDIDEELREAFMDDATRGLESMEQALLDLESSPGEDGPVKTIGRELHTIKGASASIGLSNLAAYIHEVEELIRETKESGQAITPEILLPHVDLIRARVDGDDAAEPISSTAAMAVAVQLAAAQVVTQASRSEKKPTVNLADSHGDDETVRVKASQLNRLMDMLSELVMLRNQRDTEISELKGIHDELVHSVTRIRMLSHEGEALLANENLADPVLAEDGVSFSPLERSRQRRTRVGPTSPRVLSTGL